ncbi:hypothetical protein [Actinocorallia longicatena]|uniref:Uncharacterized protein n=1 Tax=Actinocorallia longicatena TaxID=111803 RepID=A0ABP6PXQ1_9ACTN
MSSAEIFGAVRSLINRYDPEELLDIAPEDEYDPEVRDLVGLVWSEREISAGVIAQVWLARFGASDWPGERPADLAEVAEELRAIRAAARS